MANFSLTDAYPWINYDSIAYPYLYTEVWNAWKGKYATASADLTNACAALSSTYSGTDVADATGAALDDLKTKLTGKALTIDLGTAVYRPGGGGHSGTAQTLDPATSMPPAHTVTLPKGNTTVTFPVLPAVFVALK